MRGFLRDGFALSGACAGNKSHIQRKSAKPYRCIATSVEGFVQQLSVCYIARGYWFYVAGCVPEGVEPHKVDARLIAKYEITGSKHVRARQKKQGKAKVQYLRFNRFFVLLSSAGSHQFFIEESQIRDIRRQPIRFAGYSIGYGQGRDGTWHPSVRIDAIEFKFIKRRFLLAAARVSLEVLICRFRGLHFAPFAPVRDQYWRLFRAINKIRKKAGLERLPPEIVPSHRRVVRPFD